MPSAGTSRAHRLVLYTESHPMPAGCSQSSIAHASNSHRPEQESPPAQIPLANSG